MPFLSQKSLAPAASFSRRAFVVFFGIILPVAALVFELLTGMSRDYFDPIPSLGHVFAIALVPLAHLAGLLAFRVRGPRVSLALAARLNSAAIAIGLVYAACYAPITPFAFIGIIAAGLGLLPLAPLTSVFAAFAVRKGLRRHAAANGAPLPSFWPGFAVALLFLAVLEASTGWTAWGVHRLARADSPAAEAAALRHLRFAGNEEQLLAGCYERGFDAPRRTLLDSFAKAATPAAFQLAYYRVTGRPFNSVPAPAGSRRWMGGRGDSSTLADTRDAVWDTSLGDQRVGQRLRALHLTESRLDARLESAPAIGYLEWTLVFRNDHAFQQREARAVVQLPPGAVVSRLTLWVDGEEREAAFAGRDQVVGAYRAVVSQRRDPVLVTTCGPDRVLVQCFPIERGGGLMKIRLGITTPLPLAELDRAHLPLPRFIEQNFSVPSTFRHHLRVEADAPLTPSAAAPALATDETSSSRATVSGALSPAELAAPRAILSIARRPAEQSAWTPALRDPSRVVTQTLGRRAPAPGALVLVISGSGELAPAAAALAKALETETAATPFSAIVVAGDTLAISPADLDARAQARWLRGQDFAGGQDDTAALLAALDWLDRLEENGRSRAGGRLVWLHGSQPVSWQNPDALDQRLAHRDVVRPVLAVPAVSGPNLLLEKLVAAAVPVATYPSLAGFPEDFARLLRELRNGSIVATRASRFADTVRVDADGAGGSGGGNGGGADGPGLGVRVSDHLSRLWARDEIQRLLETHSPADRETALGLAVRTRIVTPVSGAVVLENQAQYDAAGLAPGDAQDSPSVPEPATTAVLFAATVLAYTVLIRRQGRIRAKLLN